ncbi:MAG TPA: hypothetical protein VKD69_07825, partial [Vicinamibacterales bacterium]|nr:hypothetical protein [Vicinamibacterales bacterium]
LSKYHEAQPFTFSGKTVHYEPAEAVEKIKGGNSNWRGPIWFPTTFLLIESLVRFDEALLGQFSVRVPGSPERPLAPREMARQLADRMIGLFTRGGDGRRRIFGDSTRFQNDPHWRDYLQFFEYFHGDTGVGLGASHQTGWTALVANLIDEWRR